MTETATPLKPKASIQPGQAYITGRIAGMRKINTQTGALWLTVLKLAAPDAYSHPSTIELRSTVRLGQNEEDWAGVVRVSGMPNNYQVTDKETGERVAVRSARNELVVVE